MEANPDRTRPADLVSRGTNRGGIVGRIVMQAIPPDSLRRKLLVVVVVLGLIGIGLVEW